MELTALSVMLIRLPDVEIPWKKMNCDPLGAKSGTRTPLGLIPLNLTVGWLYLLAFPVESGVYGNPPIANEPVPDFVIASNLQLKNTVLPTFV